MTAMDRPLETGWDHLDQGDPEAALDAAEACLENDPHDVEALHLAGCALMDLGEDAASEGRLREAVRLDPEWGAARESLAMVLYRTCRFEEGLAEIRRVVAREPDAATAIYLEGLLLDLLGRHDEADERFARAARLDPEGCPRPASMPRAEFDAVVEEALDALPEDFRSRIGNLPILVEEVPTRAILDTIDPPSPDLLGLFVGIPAPHRSTADVAVSPDAVYLFKRTLERIAADRATLVEEIRTTLLHEIGHALGMEEDDLHDAGYG